MNGGSEEEDELNINYANFAKPGQMGNTLIDQDIEECETQKADNNTKEYKYNEKNGECELKTKEEYSNEEINAERQQCLMKNYQTKQKRYFTIKKKSNSKHYVFDYTTRECKELNNWGKNNQVLY